jgi:hypothetical protein
MLRLVGQSRVSVCYDTMLIFSKLEILATGRGSMSIYVAVMCRYRSYLGIQGTACSGSFEVYFDSCYTVVTSKSSLWRDPALTTL